MIKKLQLKKLPVLLALMGVLVLPMAMRAYAQEDTPVVEATNTTEEPAVEETETPAPEAPVVVPPVEEVPEEQAPEVEDPETTVDTDGVTLGEAQIIANTEHPGSPIKKTKIKTVDGNAVYAFYFEDGWKVYVRAIDGVVVEVKDPTDKKHDCKNDLQDDAQFQAWLQERKEQRQNDDDDNNDDNDHSNNGRRVRGAHSRRWHNKQD